MTDRFDRKTEDGIDSMTGVYDANYFIHNVPELIRKAVEEGQKPYILYTDSYRIHAYNELKGYQAGDALIRRTGQTLQRYFPDGITAHYTDDRFVVLTFADRDIIIERIENVNAELIDWSAGYSSGLRAGAYYCENENILTAIDRARRTKAYYDTDHENRCHFYDSKVSKFVNNRDYLITNLKRALTEGWIKVLYQPMIGGLNFKVTRYEVVARWVDPRRGTFMPKSFIPELEAANLAKTLDLYVVENACREFRQMMDRGEEITAISCNLSNQTLEDAGIHDRINNIVRKYRLESTHIGFELIPNGREGNIAFLRDHIDRFHRDGFQIALDHFGENRNSFESLQSLDVDYLKLDIRAMDWESQKTKSLLESFVKMVRTMNACPIAVGVESRDQAVYLHRIGMGMIEGRCVTNALPGDQIYQAVKDAGYEFETKEDRTFFFPLVSIKVQEGLGAFLDNESSNLGRKTVTILSWKNGTCETIYENAFMCSLQKKAGRMSYRDLDDYLNNGAQFSKKLQNVFAEMDQIGRMEQVTIPSADPMLLRIQLVSAVGERKGFLIVGSGPEEDDAGTDASKAELANGKYKVNVPVVKGASDREEILGAFVETVSEWMLSAEKIADPAMSIQWFLEKLCTTFLADRAYAFEKNDRGTYSNTYEWCAGGVVSEKNKRQDVAEYEIRDWMEAFHKGEGFVITDMEDYRAANPEAYARFREQHIERLIVCPVSLGEDLKGYVGMDNPAGRYIQTIRSVFKLAASFISMQIRRRDNVGNLGQLRHIDPVSGLHSIDVFQNSLKVFMESYTQGRISGKWDIVNFNISQFKVYNDRFGFEAGNTLLRDLGNTILEVMKTDYLTRTGGDSFYILIRDKNAEQVIREVHDIMRDDPRHPVNIYAGIYTLTGDEGEGRYSLDRAKIAGIAASHDFENYYRRFTEEMNEDLRLSDYLVSHVDEAISKNWIKVFYQPVVDTLTGKVTALEALCRWDDPVYGFLMPFKFIDILEDARLLYKIDLYVLERVCYHIHTREEAGEEYTQVSVNLSRQDLTVEDLHARILHIMDHYMVPHDAVHFEITETALMQNEESVKDHIEEFHRDGFEVWLDDFGSGYSSLNALQNFDFDCIKIDMKFLRTWNDRTPVIMRSIVDMAKRIGMQTLCEGVETREEYDFLRRIGCTMAQGYLFSKPDRLEHLRTKENLIARGMEGESERIFFRQVGRANVLSVLSGEQADIESEIPCLIFEIEGDEAETLYINSAFREYILKKSDFTLDQVTRRKKKSEMPMGDILLRMTAYADSSGEPTRYNFVYRSNSGQLYLKKIAEYQGRKAYMLCLLNNTTFGREQDARLASVQNGFCFFESLEELNPHADMIKHIYGETDQMESGREYSLRETLKLIADRYIHPTEKEFFQQFTDPATMEQRVSATPAGILNSFFHVLRENGSYEWRRSVIARLDGYNGQEYIWALMRNRVGWSKELLDLAVSRQILPEDIEYNQNLNQLPDKAELWDAMVGASRVCLFWKDRNRRFAGVNRAFLDFYHLTEADLIGRTDEEMDWSDNNRPCDAERFKKDELRVLEKGELVEDAVGTSLSDGVERKILVNKMPIYEHGKINGILGYFSDITDSLQRLSDINTSELTGHNLPKGFSMQERFRRYILQHSVDQKGFGVIMIQMLGLVKFAEKYGQDEQDHLMRQIGTLIQETLPEGDLAGKILTGRYVILASAESHSELRKVEARLVDSLRSLHQTGNGTPVTLYFMIGSNMHTKGRSMEETYAMAEARMHRPIGSLFSDRDQQQNDNRYTQEEMEKLMISYTKIFDLVQLVNPKTNRAMRLGPEGELYEYPYHCYAYLDKGDKCTNCISKLAVTDRRNYEKTDYKGKQPYHVFSIYVEVDDKPYALECIYRITSRSATSQSARHSGMVK